MLENAHDDYITSIGYLSRAHCLVTCSLDSTVKFWGIGHSNNQLNQVNHNKNNKI